MNTSNGTPVSPELAAAAEVDFVLRRTGLPLTPEEYERFVRLYPVLLSQMQQLRVPEIRYGEPALIYPATIDR
ncbi:MAG TPA: hypothetical protein VNG11_01650 [Chloroflexota bacterium]|nr:hypothetical protein [Chloroflexota bacterium]